MGWTCPAECKYRCAQQDLQAREREQREVVQYHGKWPFQRVAGMEELVSVVASALNAVPHLIALTSSDVLHAYAPSGHPQREALLAYSIVGINAWVWSMALHTKETWVTERGDYHSASLFLLTSAWLPLLKVFGLRAVSGAGLGIAGALLAVWVGWVWYMNFVLFDYGLNMKVSVLVALISNVLWCYWALSHGCCKPSKPHAWKAPVAVFMLSALAALELLDFPPKWGLVDAHSLWHLSTVPLAFFWYKFLRQEGEEWTQHMSKERFPRADQTDRTGAAVTISQGRTNVRRRQAL
jgi:post-GPI attachment to proteins factor 3